MFRRNYIGLNICGEGLRAVAVQRKGTGVALVGGQTLRFSEGVLEPVLIKPNVLKPELFVAAVKEVLLPIAKREKRIAVALPDSVGHTYLLDIDTPFNNHAEGLEIVRWHLKDMLPALLDNYALDYQVLGSRETGERYVLASVISKDVRTQYEELLESAGFSAALLDFQTLNCYSSYHSVLELGPDFFFVSVDDSQFGMLAVENQMLDYYRTKTVVKTPEAVFQEINRSLVSYRRLHSSAGRMKVYLHTNWQDDEPAELIDAVSSAFEKTVEFLPSPLQKVPGSQRLNVTQSYSRGMAAALGIAKRMIHRVSK